MLSNLASDARSTGRAHNPHASPLQPQRDPGCRPAHGHIRHPVLAREPSALESIRTLTNTLRTLPAVFSPATKNVPSTSSPSSQRSTAHSYGRFVGSPGVGTSVGPPWSPYSAVPVDYRPDAAPAPEPGPEYISWASWDRLDGNRRLLVLGYSSGLQIWDVTSMDTLQEILNVNLTSFVTTEGLWAVRQALVLPTPCRTTGEFADMRPLVAVVLQELSQPFRSTEVFIYSLRTHTVVKRLGMLPLDDPRFGAEHSPVDGTDPAEDFTNVHELSANTNFVIVTTHSPAKIHILSATSLSIIYTIPQEALTPSPSSPSLADSPPHPTFSLTPRLLAFASPPPLLHHRARKSGPGSVASSLASGFSPTLGAIGAGGIDLVGTGAKKVGEGLWTSVRVLGGLAFGSATPQPAPPTPPMVPDPRPPAFYSRSAPNAGLDPSPPSGLMLSPVLNPMSPATSKRNSYSGTSGESVLHPPVESGYVTVLDLSPLLRGTRPTQIAHFLGTSVPSSVLPSSTSPAYAIQAISFSPSGTVLCVCDVNGHGAKVFQLRGGLRGLRDPSGWSAPEHMQATLMATGRAPAMPRRRSSGASSTSSHSIAPSRTSEVWHMYDLVRGSTHAKVDRIVWSDDARWIGIGTARGTLHMYGINPYGGKPDEMSHLDGRVRNPASLQSWPATAHPVTRLKTTAKEGFPAPVYAFLPLSVSKSSAILSPALDRQSTRTSTSPMRSIPAGGIDNSFYTRTGFQDVLAFASPTGLLTLRRCSVSLAMTGAPDDPRTTNAKARRGSATSPIEYPRSLPVSGVSMMMNLVGAPTQETSLRASEGLLASWDLKRERTWDEVKDSIAPARPGGHHRRATDHSDALSRAELSTCSRSPQILPAPIYLSHQFNFFSLKEDWHALLRQTRVDLPIRRIEVRREVEITPQGHGSAGSSLGSVARSISRAEEHETFIQETDASRAVSSSVERPIATAIQTSIDAQAAEAVMPSFPNAYKPSSWRDTMVPIRHVAAEVTDGVNESLERIKREITKARAKSPAREPSGVLSLAFEEDDEALFEQHTQEFGHLISGDMASAGGSGSTPSTTTHLETDHDKDDASDAWSTNQDEIAKVIAEEAAFDEIGVTGFIMEEEQERQRMKERVAAAKINKGGRHGGKKGKK